MNVLKFLCFIKEKNYELLYNKSTQKETYILNRNTKKFHKSTCSGVKDIKAENKEEYTGSRSDLIKEGYEPCGRCKP